MKLYLGTHKPQWLRFPQLEGVPLFISRRQLDTRAKLPAAITELAVDSGGFTELQQHGRWTLSPEEYVERLRRYRDQTGTLSWAAPQDWMAEDVVRHGGTFAGVRFVGTGLSVEAHQELTVANLIQLRELAPDLRIIPVLQGDTLPAYVRCAELYAQAGVDLKAEPLVGLGSVCRRQATAEIGSLVRELSEEGLALHGFGVKSDGLRLYGHLLATADSLAWSFHARRDAHHRRQRGLPASRLGCRHGRDGQGACNNCPRYALAWRERALTGDTLPWHDQAAAAMG